MTEENFRYKIMTETTTGFVDTEFLNLTREQCEKKYKELCAGGADATLLKIVRTV